MASCIICGEDSGDEGFVGIKKGIAVSFCKKHAADCNNDCDTCVIREECPVCGEVHHPVDNLSKDMHKKLIK